jgi:transposase
MHKRYAVLLRHFEGFTNKKIAEMEGLKAHAVGNYIKNYKLNGLAGLEIKHSNGAKRKFNIDQESKIFEVVTNNTPDGVGFEGRKNWTIELIRQWAIREFNITMSHRGMAEVFLEFLKATLKQYPEGKIVMILDNAKIHHAKLVQAFLNKMKDRIELMFLPPYSPKLNLIERLWG